MKTNQSKRVFILAALVLLGTQLFAQELFEIKIKLVKSENQASNHATGILLDSKTMEIVAENVSNDEGELIIANVKKGDYILLVRKAGYKKADMRYIIVDDKITVLKQPGNTIASSTIINENTQFN